MSQVGALDTMDLKIFRETLIEHGNKSWIRDVIKDQETDSIQMAILLKHYEHSALVEAAGSHYPYTFILNAAQAAPDAFGHAMNERGVSDSTVYELLEAEFGKESDFTGPVFTYEAYQDSFYTTPDTPYHARTLGDKRYELSNHLGNVLAVVSDRKIGVEDQGNPGTVEYYEADVVSAQDYYPFGMIQPGRSVSAGEYRYGFNSMEQDDEWSVTGGHLDFGARIHDTRIGRLLSVDPIAKEMPWLSPYQFASNSPIIAIDEDGKQAASAQMEARGMVGAKLSITSSASIGIAGDADGNVALIGETTLGGGAGQGFVYGMTVSGYPFADGVEDITGFSASAGGFYGNPMSGKQLTGEVEASFGGDEVTYGGTLGFSQLPSGGAGGGGYVEGGYTFFLTEPTSIEDFADGPIGDYAETLGISEDVLMDMAGFVVGEAQKLEEQNQNRIHPIEEMLENNQTVPAGALDSYRKQQEMMDELEPSDKGSGNDHEED